MVLQFTQGCVYVLGSILGYQVSEFKRIKCHPTGSLKFKLILEGKISYFREWNVFLVITFQSCQAIAGPI